MQEASDAHSKTADRDTVSTYQVKTVTLFRIKMTLCFMKIKRNQEKPDDYVWKNLSLYLTFDLEKKFISRVVINYQVQVKVAVEIQSSWMINYQNQKVVEIALKFFKTIDFLHTQRIFCLACLVMMKRIFRE